MKPTRLPGPDTIGWYAWARGPETAHFYVYFCPWRSLPARFKPRCGHTGRWLSRGGLVPADTRLPACQRCVAGLARDLAQSAVTPEPQHDGGLP
jgi:hypothetical protein